MGEKEQVFTLKNSRNQFKIGYIDNYRRNCREFTQSPLDQILDEIAALSLDEQEMVLHIAKKQHIERKREQILKDSRATLSAYKKG